MEITGFKIPASLVLGVLCLASLAAYVSFQSSIFGVVAFVLLVAAIAADLFLSGSSESESERKEKTEKTEKTDSGRDYKKLAIEIGVTLAVALVAWFGLSFALQTSSPLNVVTSCSMLPVLQRGDFIVLQGGGVNAFEANVSFPLGNAATQSIALDARKQGKRYYLHYTTILDYSNGSVSVQASFANYSFVDCIRVPLSGGAGSGAGNDSNAGLEACTSGVTVDRIVFEASNSNDVIVYEAQPPEYGLIIHRVLAKLKAPDGVFYLTKGDNNQFADQQLGISVVPESAVKGRVVTRIPLVGYFKLLLFMQFEFPQGCDYTLKRLN